MSEKIREFLFLVQDDLVVSPVPARAKIRSYGQLKTNQMTDIITANTVYERGRGRSRMSDVLPLIITCSRHQIDRPYIQADYSDHL